MMNEETTTTTTTSNEVVENAPVVKNKPGRPTDPNSKAAQKRAEREALIAAGNPPRRGRPKMVKPAPAPEGESQPAPTEETQAGE